MTAAVAESGLRRPVDVDYLVTNIACSPVDVDGDGSFSDLGVGSRDTVVRSGELSELLGGPASPAGYLATVPLELLAVANQESVDANQHLTDDELLKELSERLG
jgi:phthiocerol/phenolphthiocerol synthesis type-I polyketide synthase A